MHKILDHSFLHHVLCKYVFLWRLPRRQFRQWAHTMISTSISWCLLIFTNIFWHTSSHFYYKLSVHSFFIPKLESLGWVNNGEVVHLRKFYSKRVVNNMLVLLNTETRFTIQSRFPRSWSAGFMLRHYLFSYSNVEISCRFQ